MNFPCSEKSLSIQGYPGLWPPSISISHHLFNSWLKAHECRARYLPLKPEVRSSDCALIPGVKITFISDKK